MRGPSASAFRLLLLVMLGLVGGCTSEQPRGGQCGFNADCEAGLVCADGYCRAPCGDAQACPAGMRCSPVAGTALTVCVAGTEEPRCAYASDCEAPLVCSRDGRCRAQCLTDYDCRVINPFTTCAAGSCALACAAPRADCDGQARNGCEVDVSTDVTHCGACGNACRAGARQAARCEAGRCATRCEPGFADCDGDAANGCEADLADPAHCGACGTRCDGEGARCAVTEEGGARRYACASVCPAEAPTACGGQCVDTRGSAAHCGACGNACPAGPNGEARCVDGRCALVCAEPARYADCDGVAATGCEVELPRSAAHCGLCGNACAGGDNADGACVEGACGLACQTGYGNCDGERGNGCEADLRVEPASCGMCGNACPAPANAEATCAAGRCGFACAQGFGDCDGAPGNGCEVDLGASGAHCGACGRACGAGMVCASGVCGLRCPEGESVCAGACVDLGASAAHCGGCGRACPSPANARASCAEGSCGFACAEGFGDCDGNRANGCETSLATSAASCGRCGLACALANATPACAGGRCVVAACAAGFGDCDGNAANGCEVNLNATATSCGVCGRACSLANAVGACVAGACRVASCNAGFGDCDGNPANGCETNLATSVSSCGGCGVLCSSQNGSPRCDAGRCAITCAAGFGDCDGSAANGCETSTDTSVSSCGMCGRACSLPNATPVCAVGACAVARCAAGFGDCDGNAANGCEVNLNATATSCGVCGRACALPHAVAGCAAGACTVASCAAGYGDCDGGAANGCEVDLNATPASCGACGRRCALANATAGCAAGQCTVQACAAGYRDCDGGAANGCEVDVTTSTANCGACGVACGRGMVCSAGACTTVCASPTTNCSNACVNLQTDVSNCGSCGRSCPTPANATAVCAAGQCGGSCAAGFGDCNAGLADGCEANLGTSLAHCGGCGRACAPAHATGVCAAGACGVLRCDAGFGDCDGNAANGCETDLATSVSNCGGCGRACSLPNATAACVASACAVSACNAGYGNCDNSPANGCETSTTTSAAHCGGCGLPCSAANGTPACRGSQCAIACASGYANCDGDARGNGCEAALNTIANCNACGAACAYANASAACVPSAVAAGWTCQLGACGAGWGNCNQNPGDGCEANLTSDALNCGACARTCAEEERLSHAYPHTCQSSGCRPRNDLCGAADVINLAAGPSIAIDASNRFARRELAAPCQGNTSGDVWFQFTLTQRELVYADTFNAQWDTVLFLASSCTTALTGITTPGDAVCNDDASGTCANDGTRSQVVALLNPGTYYLVLAGYAANVGEVQINFQHLPVGNGTPVLFSPVSTPVLRSLAGVTSGAGQVAGTCGGNGPEVSYWWRSCSGDAGGRFFAHTCTANTNYDTLIYLRGGNATGDACNDDDAAGCPNATTRSRIQTFVPSGAGIHVFTVDGYSGAGTYDVSIAYPYTPIT